MSAAVLAAPAAADAIEVLVRATLLIGAAWGGAAALRTAGASASARHLAWLLGVAALLTLPLLWWATPTLQLPILGPGMPASAPGLATAPVLGPSQVEADHSALWIPLLLAVYAAGAVLLLLRIVLFRHLLSRLWRDAEPARDPAWEPLFRDLSDEIGVRGSVGLRIARGPAMPMTWGTLAPKVLLPAEAETWPAERRRLVLLHELAHVARRDSLSRTAASLACALYWFHPGVWLAARQMRLEQEHAADDRVLSSGAPARSYALSLVQLARQIEGGPSSGYAVAMAGMEQLERRVVSITRPAQRKRPGRAFLGASTLLAGLVTLLVSAGVPVSASPALRGPRPIEPATAPAVGPSQAATLPRTGARAVGARDVRAVLPAEGGSRHDRSSTAITRADVPQARAMAPGAGGAEDPDVTRAQVEHTGASRTVPTAGRPTPSPVDRPQVAAYGPQLPAAPSNADEDARIPELARRGRDESRDRRGRRWISPVQLVANDGTGAVTSIPPGLSLQLIQP